MNWNTLLSNKRLGMEELHAARKDDRSEFQRDYDRLIFSAPFRRLQNKTQVFPLPGSIFVHNRLTHSLEVSCVGRSLGSECARILLERHPECSASHLSELGSIVSAACLAHDLGNTPFGHSGEKAISSYFTDGNGANIEKELSPSEWNDFIHFEGNANSLRLLAHQFKGRRKGGFAMTYSTLASIVKYPYTSNYAGEKGKFGFFLSEREEFERIADELGILQLEKSDSGVKYARYPLVYLVEAADDICYLIMDMEDAHKLKLLTTDETIHYLLSFIDRERQAHVLEICNMVNDTNEKIAYLRSTVIGILIKECTRVFVENEEAILSGTFEGSLVKNMNGHIFDAYRQCSQISVKKIYRSRDVLDVELAGFKIISTLIGLMIDAVTKPQKAYSRLLIERVSEQYDMQAPTAYGKVQAVLDYISGMTDIYALDLFRKINGNSLPGI